MNDPLRPSSQSLPPGNTTLHGQPVPQIPRPAQAQPSIRPPQQMGQPAHAPVGMQPQRPVPVAPKPAPPADDSLALIEEDDDQLVEAAPKPNSLASKIKFSSEVVHKKHDWKRKSIANGTGACRIKSFHAKYSEGGLDHVDELINVWLDDHPEIEVKFCTTTVHVFEGKIREPAIVLNVWY